MQISLNTSKWYDNIWASLIFFTRIPFWRIYNPPKEAYKSVVEYWPLTGWLTSGIMAATIYFGSLIMPYSLTIIVAILSRIIVTGALHEDGLADFIDGFGGGGNNRQRILDIMKDSRIGTYGVLGLIIYMLIIFFALSSLPSHLAAMTVLAADPYAKMLASQTIMMMPYARTEETSKAHVVYRKMNARAGIGIFIQGILPLAALLYFCGGLLRWDILIFIPGVVMYFLYIFIWHRLKGYTGDCCGALFLLIELSFYICMSYLSFNNQSLWTLFS